MLPDYPNLKQRLSKKFEDIIRKKIQEEPFLSQIRRSIIQEGHTLTITSLDGYSTKTDYQKFAAEFHIGFDEMIKKGPEAFFEKASAVSTDMASKMARHTIGVLEKVTKRTGNVVTGKKGEGITPKLILDAIEKMEISFDERGNPIMPVLVMAPKDFTKFKAKQKEWESDIAIEKRRKEIIEKKRKEWLDRESNRKLAD